jgi:hypothetical protein
VERKDSAAASVWLGAVVGRLTAGVRAALRGSLRHRGEILRPCAGNGPTESALEVVGTTTVGVDDGALGGGEHY